MSVKSCSGYFQISTHLGLICTFQTGSEIWPFAKSAFPQARRDLRRCLSKGEGGVGRSVSFCILFFIHVFMVLWHSKQSQKLPAPVPACTRDLPYSLRCPWCLNFHISPRYIWPLSTAFVEQFAMFEMFSLCINLSWLKIILNINSHREITQPAFPPPCTREQTC